MTRQQLPIVITISAFALALLIWLFSGGGGSYGDNNANFPDGKIYVCDDDACNHVFNMSMTELSEHHKAHYGEPIPCPKCGKTPAHPAVKCPHCDTVSIEQRGGENCPKCGKPLHPKE